MSKATLRMVMLAATVAVVALGSGAAHAGDRATYVVVLEPGANRDVPALAAGISRANGGSLGFVYRHALHGFSVAVSPAGAAAMARNPSVAYVEKDQQFSAAAQSLPTGVQRVNAAANTAIGIDGVDDRRVDVDVAVIDTGIDLDHPDLNVVGSTNCATFFATCGTGGDDGNGHGTHVAGTIGALDNGIGVVGIAPGARLWSVRVLGNNGTGTTSQIVAGMDWVTAHAATIEVANVSIIGATSAAVDAAANRLADAGVAVAVAAGNDDADASAFSPARAAKVLTVSALADYDGVPGALSQPPSGFCLDEDDTLLDYSNWGASVEVAAPGCRILSTYVGGYAWINGTSMASAHVAGALALLASRGFPRSYAGVSSLYSTVTGNGNFEWVDDSGDGVKEPLLDVSGSAFAPVFAGTAANQPPTASFTSSCTGLTCAFNASASIDPDGSIVSYGWTFGDAGTTSGSSPTSSHTYTAGGTYSVTLTTVDDDGATASASSNVVASSPPTVALTASRVSNGSTWTATVTVAVTRDGVPASSTVAGTWSKGASGTASCATTPAPCSVSKSGIRNRTTSVTFTVNTVGGSASFGGTKSIVVTR